MSNSNSNTPRRPFMAWNAGLSKTSKGEDLPYAFHLEGIVSREPVYKPGQDGKKGFLTIGIVVGRNPWQLLGEEAVKNNAANPDCNGDKPFVDVVVFSPLAEKLKDSIMKRSKVVLCGRPVENSYTRKSDGATVNTVRIYADELYPLSCRATAGGTPGTNIAHAPQKYIKRSDGSEGVTNLGTLVAGVVKSVQSVREVNGQQVISWEMELPVPALLVDAVINGTYQKGKDYGTYRQMSCSVWGPRAQHLAGRVLAEGNTLVITGSTSQREHNGQQYVNFTVRELSVMNWVNDSTAAAPAGTGSPAAAAAAADAGNAPVDNYGPADDIGSDLGSLMDGDDFELPF